MKFRYQKLPIGSFDPKKPLVARPYLPIYLIGQTHKTKSPYFALLDSGADRVIFPSDLAKEVGVDNIETGKLEPTIGIGEQRINVYFHELKIKVMGELRELPTEIGFSHDFVVPLLGRSFFKHYRAVIFSEIKEEIELKP